MKEQPLFKSLAPLIVFIVLIIVLSLIIRGSRNSPPQSGNPHSNSSPLEMRLSPFSYRHPRRSVPQSGPRMIIPGPDDTLNAATRDCDNGRYAQAEDRLRNAVVFHGESRALLSMLGTTLYLQQKYREAEAIFRHLTLLNPDDTAAYNNLGAALAKQKRYREAIASVEKIYRKEPDSPITALNLSGMHSMAGNTAEALEYFKKAYENLGERILPLSYNSNFDNIRREKAFREIVEKAQGGNSLSKGAVKP